MPSPADLKPFIEILLREGETVLSTLRDKGAKRFGRAFASAGFLVFGSYMLLYRPPQSKSEKLDAQIKTAKMMHDYGEQYTLLRDQLVGAYGRLPNVNDREQWLSNSVRALLDAGKLETEDFKPTRESEKNGLIFQTSSITMNLRFSDFYGLVLRVESAKPIMHLQRVDLDKKTDVTDTKSIGVALANCDIATVIPKKRLDQ
jgi:hypothetical protein